MNMITLPWIEYEFVVHFPLARLVSEPENSLAA